MMNPLIICTLFFIKSCIVQTCHKDLPQDVVQDWLKRRILEGLQLDKPPVMTLLKPFTQRLHAAAQQGAWQVHRESHWDRRHHQDISQAILFPSSDSSCRGTDSGSYENASSHFTYYFQTSLDCQESTIISVDFWFHACDAMAKNTTSVPLYIFTSQQELKNLAQRPSNFSTDGWSIYRFKHHFHNAITNGPFLLHVRCLRCGYYASERDKIPFLHVHVRHHVPKRARRSPSIIWSPDVLEKLQRPSSEKDDTYCRREQINISFKELGWDNWIVHPKSFNFYYCHGNCSNPEFTATLLGIRQCCAPVPESMKSLRFTTTSDGGFSFKYETLPNIIPDECNCI